MARKASGTEAVKRARACIVQARTAEELREAQAVLLPLEFGLSLQQTARAIGVSVGWVCRLRRRFIAEGALGETRRARPGGRRRQNMTPEGETEFLAPFFERAGTGGALSAGEVKQALDRRLGRKVALASVYNLLHRHGWRKP